MAGAVDCTSKCSIAAELCMIIGCLSEGHMYDTSDGCRILKKMVTSVPYMAAVYISSPNPEYQCLTASLTSFNEKLQQGSYSWYFKSLTDHKTVVKQVNFDVTPGNSSDTLHFTIEGGGSKVYTSYYPYCNYENCLVAKIPYNNEDLCILWITPEVVDNIPHECLSQYHVTCPVEYRAYYSDIC